MPRRNMQNAPLEESPLMSKNSTSLQGSTIHPERMDQSRFTDMVDLDEDRSNPVRIVIYAVIIILIGVGAAFLVRTLISNNQQNQSTNQKTEEDQGQEEVVSAYIVSLTPKTDSSATNLAANEDYVDSETVTLGDPNLNMSNVELSGIRYDKYTTFARTTFDFTGNITRLPKTTINYSNNTLTIAFQGLTKIENDLLSTRNINDIVKSISYDTENSQFTVNFSEDAKYRVIQSSGDLIIDVKTLEELEKTETQNPIAEEEAEETPTVPSSNDTSKPTAPHYTNNFSQKKQYLSSSVSTNTLGFNNFWIWDEGSFFEFSLGQTNVVGDEKTPNTTAYLAEETGKAYLYLEIENLSNAPFSQTKTRTLEDLIQSSGAVIDTSKVNFVKVDLVSFTEGKATYKLELKKKADFKLLSQKTYDGSSQIISVQIKD